MSVCSATLHIMSISSEIHHFIFQGMCSVPASFHLNWIWYSCVWVPIPFHSVSAFYSGPFGERDEEQVFIQRIIPETNKIFVRFSSTGNR